MRRVPGERRAAEPELAPALARRQTEAVRARDAFGIEAELLRRRRFVRRRLLGRLLRQRLLDLLLRRRWRRRLRRRRRRTNQLHHLRRPAASARPACPASCSRMSHDQRRPPRSRRSRRRRCSGTKRSNGVLLRATHAHFTTRCVTRPSCVISSRPIRSSTSTTFWYWIVASALTITGSSGSAALYCVSSRSSSGSVTGYVSR